MDSAEMMRPRTCDLVSVKQIETTMPKKKTKFSMPPASQTMEYWSELDELDGASDHDEEDEVEIVSETKPEVEEDVLKNEDEEEDAPKLDDEQHEEDSKHEKDEEPGAKRPAAVCGPRKHKRPKKERVELL